MRRTVCRIVLLTAVAVGSCGKVQSCSGAQDECGDFHAEVNRGWNSQVKSRVRAAYAMAQGGHSRRMAEQVIAKMAELSRSWVVVRASLCLDCVERENTPKEVCAMVSRCLDSVLERQQALSAFLGSADRGVLDRAYEGIAAISSRLDACQKPAVWQTYGPDTKVADPVGLAVAEHQAARAHIALCLGKTAQADQAAHQARVAAKKAGSKRLEAEALATSGWVDLDRIRFDEAKGKFERAMALSEQTADERGQANAHNGLGRVLTEKGEFAKALEHLDLAERLCFATDGDQSIAYATILSSIGAAHEQAWTHEKAARSFERALAIEKKVYGPDHPEVAKTLNRIGSAWGELGRHKKALGFFEQALVINKEAYGEVHASVATTLANMGLAWNRRAKHDKARELYEQALAMWGELHENGHPQEALALNRMGMVWDALGKHKKAIELYEQALAIEKAVLGDDHPDVATRLNSIGGSWYFLGKYRKALKFYEQALAIENKVYGEDNPKVAVTLNNVGGALYSLRRYKKALGSFQKSLEILKKVLHNSHPLVNNRKQWVDQCRLQIVR